MKLISALRIECCMHETRRIVREGSHGETGGLNYKAGLPSDLWHRTSVFDYHHERVASNDLATDKYHGWNSKVFT